MQLVYKTSVVLSILCVSCAGLGQKMAERMGYVHLELNTPPATAPEADRIEAYKNLRLDKLSSTTTNGFTQNTIILSDGSKIYYPSDLRAVVAADSETAKHLDVVDAESKIASKGGGRAALLFMGGFLLLAGSGLGTFFLVDGNNIPQGVALGVVGVSSFTFGLVSVVRQSRHAKKHTRLASEATESASESYNQDLLKQLNLCFDNKKVVFGCEKQGVPQ